MNINDDSRNRHDRLESHFGFLEATLVELSSDISASLLEGTTLEVALQAVHDALVVLEDGGEHMVIFTGDAWIV